MIMYSVMVAGFFFVVGLLAVFFVARIAMKRGEQMTFQSKDDRSVVIQPVSAGVIENSPAPSIDQALAAIDYWQHLERIYAPVRSLSATPAPIAFSINSSQMLNLVPGR